MKIALFIFIRIRFQLFIWHFTESGIKISAANDKIEKNLDRFEG